MDVCWLTMTLCNTADGLFEAHPKTIYIPFSYLTSDELWLLPMFYRESFRLATKRRSFELYHCGSGRGQGVAVPSLEKSRGSIVLMLKFSGEIIFEQ